MAKQHNTSVTRLQSNAKYGDDAAGPHHRYDDGGSGAAVTSAAAGRHAPAAARAPLIHSVPP